MRGPAATAGVLALVAAALLGVAWAADRAAQPAVEARTRRRLSPPRPAGS